MISVSDQAQEAQEVLFVALRQHSYVRVITRVKFGLQLSLHLQWSQLYIIILPNPMTQEVGKRIDTFT